jgi:hypothetical protein
MRTLTQASDFKGIILKHLGFGQMSGRVAAPAIGARQCSFSSALRRVATDGHAWLTAYQQHRLVYRRWPPNPLLAAQFRLADLEHCEATPTQHGQLSATTGRQLQPVQAPKRAATTCHR